MHLLPVWFLTLCFTLYADGRVLNYRRPTEKVGKLKIIIPAYYSNWHKLKKNEHDYKLQEEGGSDNWGEIIVPVTHSIWPMPVNHRDWHMFKKNPHDYKQQEEGARGGWGGMKIVMPAHYKNWHKLKKNEHDYKFQAEAVGEEPVKHRDWHTFKKDQHDNKLQEEGAHVDWGGIKIVMPVTHSVWRVPAHYNNWHKLQERLPSGRENLQAGAVVEEGDATEIVTPVKHRDWHTFKKDQHDYKIQEESAHGGSGSMKTVTETPPEMHDVLPYYSPTTYDNRPNYWTYSARPYTPTTGDNQQDYLTHKKKYDYLPLRRNMNQELWRGDE